MEENMEEKRKRNPLTSSTTPATSIAIVAPSLFLVQRKPSDKDHQIKLLAIVRRVDLEFAAFLDAFESSAGKDCNNLTGLLIDQLEVATTPFRCGGALDRNRVCSLPHKRPSFCSIGTPDCHLPAVFVAPDVLRDKVLPLNLVDTLRVTKPYFHVP